MTLSGRDPQYEVRVTTWFAAAHQLRLPGGELEPLHGHNWNVCVTYAGDTLDDMGVLVDFVALRARLEEIRAELHDRQLNELEAFVERNPSAENVARHIAETLGAGDQHAAYLRCVEVEEEPGCFARYYPKTPDEGDGRCG